MSSRWDYLYDLKAVSLEEHLVDEVAKELAKRLNRWPPEVWEWASVADERRFSPLVAPGSKRPDDKVFREAFKLARWEMAREFEAIDAYMRGEDWARCGLSEASFDALIFLYKYLTEEMLALSEVTECRIGRKALLVCLDKAERYLAFQHVILP